MHKRNCIQCLFMGALSLKVDINLFQCLFSNSKQIVVVLFQFGQTNLNSTLKYCNVCHCCLIVQLYNWVESIPLGIVSLRPAVYWMKKFIAIHSLFQKVDAVKVHRIKVRSIFLSCQTRQTLLVILPGCIGECVLSGKT